jgi:hypothetical protein
MKLQTSFICYHKSRFARLAIAEGKSIGIYILFISSMIFTKDVFEPAKLYEAEIL